MIFLAPQLIAQQRTAMIHLAHRRLHAAVGHARRGPRQDDYPLRAERSDCWQSDDHGSDDCPPPYKPSSAHCEMTRRPGLARARCAPSRTRRGARMRA
jgi:hypothetical protein